MADNEKLGGQQPDETAQNEPYAQTVDVSEPRPMRREIDIIAEAVKNERREWRRAHMIYIYAVAGAVVVALIFLFIHLYNLSTNPLSRFVSSSTKNFGTSFTYDITLTKDGEQAMRFNGGIEVNRSTHLLRTRYDAEYADYTYQGAAYSNGYSAIRGSFYKGKWETRECIDMVQDFFDFDRDFRNGDFDAGAFLRFLGISSEYSTRQMESYAGIVKNRLSTDSPIAAITSVRTDGGTVYNYDIDIRAFFGMVRDSGAPLFYSAAGYNDFVQRFELNEDVLRASRCTISFTVDNSGYLSEFSADISAGGSDYSLSCVMSDFGATEVELPTAFFKAAGMDAPES